MTEDRTVRAHRVLVNVEEALAKAQRDREFYKARKERMVDGLSLADAMKASAWYEGMIAEQTHVIDALRKVLGEPWGVSSDELPDLAAADPLAAGDHFARAEDFDEDDPGPPAWVNREGDPTLNGAFR